MKKRFYLLLSMLILVGLIFSACSPASSSTPTDATDANSGTEAVATETKEEAVLNIAFHNFGLLDPSRTQTTYGDWMLKCIYEPLVRVTPEGTLDIGNGLASSMDVSDDKTVYTFTLKDNCTWENGDPVTAYDFLYSFKRTLDPDTASPYASVLFSLKNAQAVFNGEMDISMLGASAVDDYTLELTYEYPIFGIEPMLLSAAYMPQNEEFTEAAGENMGTSAEYLLSCGPFTCTEVKADEMITMVKNDSYYEADKVALDKVVYYAISDTNTKINLYETGDIDITFYDKLIAPQYDGSEHEKMMNNPNSNYIYFNYDKEPYLANANIRRALMLGCDASAVINTCAPGCPLSYGVGCAGQQGPGGMDYAEYIMNEKYVYFDAAEAKRLFDEGLAELGITAEEFGKAVTFEIAAFYEQRAQVFLAQWKENLGVDITLVALTDSEGVSRLVTHDFDLTMMQMDSTSADPLFTLAWFGSSNDMNFGGFSDAEYDRILDIASKETSDQRYEYCKQLERILADNAVVYPTFLESIPILCNPNLLNANLCPLVFGFEEKNISFKD